MAKGVTFPVLVSEGATMWFRPSYFLTLIVHRNASVHGWTAVETDLVVLERNHTRIKAAALDRNRLSF